MYFGSAFSVESHDKNTKIHFKAVLTWPENILMIYGPERRPHSSREESYFSANAAPAREYVNLQPMD